MTGTVLILGPSGKIGRHAAQTFQAAGWTVRPYRRGTDMSQAAMGADVIINGLNPPNYHNWAKLIPEITQQVIAAARASGATVIIPGNVYNFGATPGLWSEDTPQRPNTRKGQIRVEMEQAYRASGVRTIILRAGSFIDPDGQGDVMAVAHLRSIAAGKVTALGPADVQQAYVWLPDWARAALCLAQRRETLAAFEDVPLPGLSFSAEDLRAALEARLNRRLTLTQFPWWLLSLLSPFWELAREMREMRPLWATDHRLDGSKLARLCPDFTPTAPETVFDLVADTYRSSTSTQTR